MKDDMDDRDDIDDVEDQRLSLRDMAEMRVRFVHYLARLDERINLAAAKETVAVANDKKEIDWLEEHVADAGDAVAMEYQYWPHSRKS